MKTGYFESKPGEKSSTRLSSFVLLIGFIVFVAFWFYAGNDITGNFILFSLLILTGVFAPKYIHKLAEAKMPGLKQDNKPVG